MEKEKFLKMDQGDRIEYILRANLIKDKRKLISPMVFTFIYFYCIVEIVFFLLFYIAFKIQVFSTKFLFVSNCLLFFLLEFVLMYDFYQVIQEKKEISELEQEFLKNAK